MLAVTLLCKKKIYYPFQI